MLPAQRVSTLFPYTTLFRSAYTSLRDYEKSLEYALEAEKLSSHLRSDFVHLKVLAGVAVRYHELGVNDKTLKLLDRIDLLSYQIDDKEIGRASCREG